MRPEQERLLTLVAVLENRARESEEFGLHDPIYVAAMPHEYLPLCKYFRETFAVIIGKGVEDVQDK